MMNVARAAADALYWTGMSHVAARRYRGRGAIFGFHSIVPDRSRYLDGWIRTSVALLDAWLRSLRESGTEVVTMDRAVCNLRCSQRQPFVVATFDDGYLDNLTRALPIFEKYECPLTIFVTSKILTRELYMWWIGLERLFQEREVVEIAPMHRRWSVPATKSKRRAYNEVSAWVLDDVQTRAPLLQEVFTSCGISLDGIVAEIGLNVDQVRSLARHPLVTIGAHTASHPQLARLGEAEARAEMLASKMTLEGITDSPVDHFSYPFGGPAACGEREARLAREVGFKTAITTRSGCLFHQHLEHLHLLPRVSPNALHGRLESLSLMEIQRHGTLRFLKSRGADPVVTL